MKSFRIKFFAGILAILLLLGFGYYYREDVSRLLQGLLNQWQPCQRPITYSIVNLDPRFGLTKAELLNDIKLAEKIWESPINKQLFEYSPTGDLKISFIYDYRQKATDALKKIGIVLDDNQATYDALKAKYDLLTASYDKEKARLEILIATHNISKSALEKDINSLNELADTINLAETVLNKLVVTLNLQVNKYNAIGSSTGKEFNEGEYINNANGTAIDIFQFSNASQLVRVLAHELGHALGLGHLDNPKAIMYYLNEGGNEKLTADDLAALKKVCGIK